LANRLITIFVKDRAQRLNSLIKREVNQIFLRDFDFSDEALVTITKVETSANLIQAKVYISVLPDQKKVTVFRTINKDIFAIQKKINKRLKIRPVPKIIFVAEQGIKEAGRIEEILEKIKRDTNNTN